MSLHRVPTRAGSSAGKLQSLARSHHVLSAKPIPQLQSNESRTAVTDTPRTAQRTSACEAPRGRGTDRPYGYIKLYPTKQPSQTRAARSSPHDPFQPSVASRRLHPSWPSPSPTGGPPRLFPLVPSIKCRLPFPFPSPPPVLLATASSGERRVRRQKKAEEEDPAPSPRRSPAALIVAPAI